MPLDLRSAAVVSMPEDSHTDGPPVLEQRYQGDVIWPGMVAHVALEKRNWFKDLWHSMFGGHRDAGMNS